MAVDPNHPQHAADRQAEVAYDSADTERPDWLSEAFEIFSVDDHPGAYAGKDAERVRATLEAAGIPCFLEFVEDPTEDGIGVPQHRWTVSAPGRFNMQAASILDRDIYNDEFEADWKNHLEMLSDQELNDAQPEKVFYGLFDRVERVVHVYREELSRRGLHP